MSAKIAADGFLAFTMPATTERALGKVFLYFSSNIFLVIINSPLIIEPLSILGKLRAGTK